MAELITSHNVAAVLQKVCHALNDQSDYLTSLDQAMGDGDTGITLSRWANGVLDYIQATPAADDLGKYLAGAGMAANKAAPSTLGTVLATALMRAGKEIKGKSEISATDLAGMAQAAVTGIMERGKANLGDKTIVDAIHPAAEAFAAAVAQGDALPEAAQKALAAATAGRDGVTPLRSRIGRASWVGERTEGKVDPGCAALVIMLEAAAQ